MSRYFRTRGWKNRKGFALLPALWVILVELGITYAMFVAMFYDIASRVEP